MYDGALRTFVSESHRMVIMKTSTFNHAKGQGSAELLHDTDKNHKIFQHNKRNSESCTEIAKESMPTPNGDGFFYKRRRLSRGGVAVLQEKNPQDQSSDYVRGLNRCTTSTSISIAPERENIPSKSSKNASVKKLPQGILTHIKCKKLCLSILNDAALEGRDQVISSQTYNRKDVSIKASLRCKACEKFEESSNMLICDCCEAAYHLSCCETVTKILEEGEDWFDWYCQACSLSKKATQASWEGEISGEGRSILINPIQAMLVDKRSYRSAVRIGEQFQADVPEWSGLVNEDSSDYFSKPKELDVISDSTSELWCNWPRSKSFGNWVQCQEIISANDSDELTICGKWRRCVWQKCLILDLLTIRVPLEVVQTDDWDCSCLLPHDPFHADCAVPQEAESEEVIKQLKVLETARRLLENHKKKT